MLNKIIKELEAKIAEYDILTDVIKDVSYEKERFVLKYAISIIKQSESEFDRHPLSPEDIERAAKSHSDDRDSQMSFTEGANFAKQPHPNEWVVVPQDDEDDDFNDEPCDYYQCMCCGNAQQSSISCNKCAGPLTEQYL